MEKIMKKIVLALALTSLSTVAMADNDVGCGFGTQVWKGKSGLVFKVLAATTNGSFGNQTFGITFGTLGCKKGGVITAEAQTGMFIKDNAEALARDMAVGEGETLNVLADLMGVADKAKFSEVAKSNFDVIYSDDNQTTGQIHAAIKAVMTKEALI